MNDPFENDQTKSIDGPFFGPGASDTKLEQGASMARIENGEPVMPADDDHEIDNGGTDQSDALQTLKNIRDRAFDSSDQKLALALGRPTEEIEAWTKGTGTIDGDMLLKARTLAIKRDLDPEQS
jgi:hypothetical protein